MEISCPKCSTKFNLDDSMLPPEGGWVRCTRCQEVFLAEREAPQLDLPVSYPQQEDASPPLRGAAPSLDRGPLADFGLGGDHEPPVRGKSGFLKFLFFLLILLIILPALALGSLLAADRFNLMPQLLDPLRGLPGFNLILNGSAPPAEGSLSLTEVRAYYRNNQHAGRILIIQGGVLNNSGRVLEKVLVMGQVIDIRNNPARQATVYAGPVFKEEELRNMTLNEIQSRLSRAQDSRGVLYELPAHGTLPFMIVLSNPPDNGLDFVADIVGWEERPR
ncbi:MAG: zinc-ribbon domain-containing protein [Desulfarculales bacterium]|jgi:predicted Zn finger-like uncharacterized protein|nr:zinc-ribbon domain-containing protein [Desulfarculales bacterium]